MLAAMLNHIPGKCAVQAVQVDTEILTSGFTVPSATAHRSTVDLSRERLFH